MSHGRRPRPDYDPERLRRLHEIDGLTVTLIAERLGKSRQPVSTWMKESGIAVQRVPRRIVGWGSAMGRNGRR
jgi:hypothetical protein